MEKINYDRETEKIIESIKRSGEVPTLLLHCCCAPCSSYVLEYLSPFFKITAFFYNPNIGTKDEYAYRRDELKRFISQFDAKNEITVIDGDYEPDVYYKAVQGMEKEPERGARCEICFRLRLEETATLAQKEKFDYFATTLTLSPLKNAELINKIGLSLAEKYEINYLCSDFKKKNGYKRSIELSKEYDLYRQNYCGCAFSKRD